MNLYFLQGLFRKPSRWTYMSDLIVLILNETDTRRFQKTREDSHTKVEGERLPSGAAWPHLQVAKPLGPHVSLRVAMSVLHRLLGCIFTVL